MADADSHRMTAADAEATSKALIDAYLAAPAESHSENDAKEAILAAVEGVMISELRRNGRSIRVAGDTKSIRDSDHYLQALCDLWTKLHALKASADAQSIHVEVADSETSDPTPITNLFAFARALARNVVFQELRKRYPRRMKLRSTLLQVLSPKKLPDGKAAKYAIWRVTMDLDFGATSRVSGRREWTGSQPNRQERKYVAIARNPESIEDEVGAIGLSVICFDFKHVRRAVDIIFDWLAGPLEVDVLLNGLVEIGQIREPILSSLSSGALSHDGDDDGQSSGYDPASPEPTADQHVLFIEFLNELWGQISAMTPKRAFIALTSLGGSLTDGDRSVAELLVFHGVASPHQLMNCLQFTPLEYIKLLRDLPLSDDKVAAHLAITPANVHSTRSQILARLRRDLAPELESLHASGWRRRPGRERH